jgi:hypothetical protein
LGKMGEENFEGGECCRTGGPEEGGGVLFFLRQKF